MCFAKKLGPLAQWPGVLGDAQAGPHAAGSARPVVVQYLARRQARYACTSPGSSVFTSCRPGSKRKCCLRAAHWPVRGCVSSGPRHSGVLSCSFPILAFLLAISLNAALLTWQSLRARPGYSHSCRPGDSY
jgi:hypothetical protein